MIPFWKLQSIGNDFPLVHIEDFPGDTDLSQLAIRMSDRHFGVGGDGLLTLEKTSDADVLRMRMFNPDGTEDFCGNGLRCAARHAREIGWVGDEFTLLHLDKSVPVRVADGKVQTTLGPASYAPSDVPNSSPSELFRNEIALAGESFTVSSLTTGSTHLIIPVSTLPASPWFERMSAQIEVDPLFPDRTSIIWTQVLAPDHLKIRIWERGVGETFGCGTGSSAAAADHLRYTSGTGTITVSNRGGDVRVSASGWDQPLVLEGVAVSVYSGEFI